MFSIVLLIVLLIVFGYGVSILFKGEFKLDGGNLLTGKSARLIGALFALSPFISFILANIAYLVLLLFEIDVTQNDLGSTLASVAILAALLLLNIVWINGLSKRLYARQAANARDDA